MVHIVCVKHGNLYSAEYVNKLYRAVERNTTMDFRFTCFTEDPIDVDVEVECRNLPVKNIEGWWQKMYLFSNDIQITDRILYFDLDTVIVGNIDGLMKFDGEFAILRDFYRARKNTQALDFGSGVMAWRGGWRPEIWSDFYGDHAKNSKTGGGDQKYLMQVIPASTATYWQDYLPDQLVSYKTHCIEGVPDKTRVICFHGKPRPHEVKHLDWMKIHWR